MLLREITREVISSICLEFVEENKNLVAPTQKTINTAINYINDLRCMNLFLKESFEISLCSNGTIRFNNSKRGFSLTTRGEQIDYTIKDVKTTYQTNGAKNGRF